jgi:ribosomal protein S18 acetylase RimI-like enzyme
MNGLAARVSVRSASLADIERLVPLFDAYRRFYGQLGDTALAREFLTDRLIRSESQIVMAGDPNEPSRPALGFAQLYPTFSSIRCRRALVLNDLYVAAEHRGAGIGLALLDHVRDLAAGLGAASISLQTAVDNEKAQGLYARFGFVRDEHFLSYVLTLS